MLASKISYAEKLKKEAPPKPQPPKIVFETIGEATVCKDLGKKQ